MASALRKHGEAVVDLVRQSQDFCDRLQAAEANILDHLRRSRELTDRLLALEARLARAKAILAAVAEAEPFAKNEQTVRVPSEKVLDAAEFMSRDRGKGSTNGGVDVSSDETAGSMIKLQQRDPHAMLYEVDDGEVYVEASSLREAVEKWRAWVHEENQGAPDYEYDPNAEPDSVRCVYDGPVVR